jgi:hypothetical protein
MVLEFEPHSQPGAGLQSANIGNLCRLHSYTISFPLTATFRVKKTNLSTYGTDLVLIKASYRIYAQHSSLLAPQLERHEVQRTRDALQPTKYRTEPNLPKSTMDFGICECANLALSG